jgi:hypothetical protein
MPDNKATTTHSEYVILISFPRQQWLRERVSLLHYTYTAYLVECYVWIYLYITTRMSSIGVHMTVIFP